MAETSGASLAGAEICTDSDLCLQYWRNYHLSNAHTSVDRELFFSMIDQDNFDLPAIVTINGCLLYTSDAADD